MRLINNFPLKNTYLGDSIRNFLSWFVPFYTIFFFLLWLFFFDFSSPSGLLLILFPVVLYYGSISFFYCYKRLCSYRKFKKERFTNKIILNKIGSAFVHKPSPICQKFIHYTLKDMKFDFFWLKKLFGTQLDLYCTKFFSLFNDFYFYEEDIQSLFSLLNNFLGSSSFPPLSALLGSTSPKKKLELLKILAEKPIKPILDDLSDFIKDSNQSVRQFVVSTLSKLSADSQSALRIILEIVKSSDHSLRLIALKILSRLYFPEPSLPPLLNEIACLIEDKNSQIRTHAIWILYTYRTNISSDLAKLVSISDLFQQYALTDKKHQIAGILVHLLPLCPPQDLHDLIPQIIPFYVETKAPVISQVILNLLNTLPETKILTYDLDRRTLFEIYSLLKEHGVIKPNQTFKRLINYDALIGLHKFC